MTFKLKLLILIVTLFRINLAQSIGNGLHTGDVAISNGDTAGFLLNSNQIGGNVPTINNMDNLGLGSGLLSFQNSAPEPLTDPNNISDLNRSSRGTLFGGIGNQFPFQSSFMNSPANQISNSISGFKGFPNSFGTGTAVSGFSNCLSNGLTNRAAIDGNIRSVRGAGIDNLINQAGLIGNPFAGTAGTFGNTVTNPAFLTNPLPSTPTGNSNIILNNPGFSTNSLDLSNQNAFNGIANSVTAASLNNMINPVNSLTVGPLTNSNSVSNAFAGTNLPNYSNLDLANHKKTLATLTGLNPSNLGTVSKLAVTSSTALSPTGLSILAENLMMDGSVSVTGKMPFVGTVNVEGTIPDNGIGTVLYECGTGNVGIISDDRGLIGQNNFGAGRPFNNGVGGNLLGFNNRGFARNN